MYGRVISTNLPPPQFAHTRTHGHTDTRTHQPWAPFDRYHAFRDFSETFSVCPYSSSFLLTDSFYSHAQDKAKFNDQLWKIDID